MLLAMTTKVIPVPSYNFSVAVLPFDFCVLSSCPLPIGLPKVGLIYNPYPPIGTIGWCLGPPMRRV